MTDEAARYSTPAASARGGEQSIRLQFDVIGSEHEFHRLRPVWNALFQQQEQFPEQSFDRALAAWETIGRPRGRGLHIIVGRTAGEAVVIFPMTMQRTGPIRIGRALGPEFYETCDVLVRSSSDCRDWVRQTWDFALSRFDVVRLPAVRTTAHIWPEVERSGTARFDLISSLYIDASAWDGWDGYYRSRSANFRKDHRTSLKRLQQAGAVRWKLLDQPDLLPETLDWMFAHKLDWLERNGSDATLARHRAFYARLCDAALRAGELVLIELFVDEVRVAAQIGFRAGARLDCDMIAWDPAWKECGPGRALDVHTIQWAFENSVRFIELGVFGHPSKYRFTDTAVDTAFSVVIAPRARGRVLLSLKNILDGARTRLRRVVRKAPA
jgi:CelD/BcsL family acetyltransferase involved in cellulose biosynthesis